MGNTTKLFAWNGSSYLVAQAVYASQFGGAYSPAKGVYAWNQGSSSWVLRYSTPTISAGNATGSGSGPTPSGSVSASPSSVSVGGYNSGGINYSWSYVSGDAGISINNSALSNPTWNKTVSAGSTSAVWRLIITDTATGATQTTTITVSLTWTNTWSPFSQTITTSQTIQVPSGATQLVLNVWGSGGKGGNGATGSNDHQGGGGASGGFSQSVLTVTSSDWGQNITITISASCSVSGALGISITATGGAGGINALSTTNGAGGSPAGTGSGGNSVNATGTVGTTGNTGGTGGQGGPANNGWGAGGQGGYTVSGIGAAGQAAQAQFQWN